MNVVSATLIVRASDEFLSRLSESLVSGGTMSRSAIGSSTRRYAWTSVRPVDRAASSCVAGTDWMPARTISAIRAP
jgi:hypothetical protein